MTTAVSLKFPSTAFFNELAERMSGNEDLFRKLGFIDATVGIEILPGAGLEEAKAYVLTFSAYTCDRVVEAPSLENEAVDFALRSGFGTWKEMLQNIAENGEADLRHTLNYLHFGPIELVAADQLKADLFFRVNGSLQAFFDQAAGIDAEYGG